MKSESTNIIISSELSTHLRTRDDFSEVIFLTKSSCTTYSVKYIYKMSDSHMLHMVIKPENFELNIRLLSCLTLFLDVNAKQGHMQEQLKIVLYDESESLGLHAMTELIYGIFDLYMFTFMNLYNIPLSLCYV